jgi:hypothetical protein
VERSQVVDGAAASLYARPRRQCWFASSGEPQGRRSAGRYPAADARGVRWHYEKMPEEKHATIYHPAALKAFRMMLTRQRNQVVSRPK